MTQPARRLTADSAPGPVPVGAAGQGMGGEAGRFALPAEPATPRALWPTFMRRTLSEEALHRGIERAAAE